jgi:hypothetical protein
MRIILGFRFAIFDRKSDVKILTQGREGAKTQRSVCQRALVAVHQALGKPSVRLQHFAPSRLAVETVKVVKVAMAKNHLCNWLTMNGVKPSQGKSNQLVRLDWRLGRRQRQIELFSWQAARLCSISPFAPD